MYTFGYSWSLNKQFSLVKGNIIEQILKIYITPKIQIIAWYIYIYIYIITIFTENLYFQTREVLKE